MEGKRIAPKKRHSFIDHIASIGFTNRMAVYLMIMLTFGLLGGFVLAVLSIKYQYAGALACWTVVFTPIGTAIGIVLAKIVNKSKEENTGSDGEGIVYAAKIKCGSENSPSI